MATCSTQSLLADASQFGGVPPGIRFPVKLALLVQILQSRDPSFTLNVQDLVTRASCFLCAPPILLRLLKLQLLCEIAGGTATCVETNKVPTMTSNTAPIGVASANAEPSGAAFRAFDGNDVTFWNSQTQVDGDMNPNGPQWIQYQFSTPTIVTDYLILVLTLGSQFPTDWNVSGSNDGVAWTVLDSHTGDVGWISGLARAFDISSPQSFLYYRLTITKQSGAGSIALNTLQFLGC